MSDEQEDWADEPAVPPKKRGLPGWLMFCGGGCLIAVILGAIAGYLLVREVKEAMDPEAQWERLGESIAYDARPPELNMMFGWNVGVDVWVVEDKRGYIAIIYDFGESEADSRDEIFSENFKGGGVPGLSNIDDPEVGEVMVQGRALPIVRFQNQGGINFGGQEEVAGQGAACFLDLTSEGDPGFKMLFLMRATGGKEPIPDSAVQDILEPFLIGPAHETYVVPTGHGDHGLHGELGDHDEGDPSHGEGEGHEDTDHDGQ
jgi:hypothetical protein